MKKHLCAVIWVDSHSRHINVFSFKKDQLVVRCGYFSTQTIYIYIYIYYHLFYHLEECGTIDPANHLHLYGLHYTYVPRINQHLDTWREGYKRHRIRTAGNRSPMELYILGLLQMRGSDSIVAREMYEPRTDVSKCIVQYLHIFMYHLNLRY